MVGNMRSPHDESTDGGYDSDQVDVFISVMPPKMLDFFVVVGSKSASSRLSLTNSGDRSVAFKVKCTSPSMYRMSPKQGILHPNSTMDIAVLLLDVNHCSMSGMDKFLLVHTPVDGNVTASQVRDMYSPANRGKHRFGEHRLGCRIITNEHPGHGDQKDNIHQSAIPKTVALVDKHNISDNIYYLDKWTHVLLKMCLMLLAIILLSHLCSHSYSFYREVLYRRHPRVQYLFYPGPFPFF